MPKKKKTKVETGKDIFPVIPLRDLVVFPHMVVPLFVGRQGSVAALEKAMAGDRQLVLLAQRKSDEEEPDMSGLYKIGTLVEVLQVFRLGDGATRVLVDGKARVKVLAWPGKEIALEARVQVLAPASSDKSSGEMDALCKGVIELFDEHVKLSGRLAGDAGVAVLEVREPGRLADAVASNLNLKVGDKQAVLEALDPAQRLAKVAALLSDENTALGVDRKVQGRVRKQMEKSQRDYYLQEQMKAIQKELGDKGGEEDEIGELRKKLKSLKLSRETLKKAEREIARLEKTAPMSAEATVIRTWLETFLDVPWNKLSTDRSNLKDAEKILEEDHDGMKKPKTRILEYLAVKKLAKKIKGPILCLAGPPGVGKTSLARSIARSLDRKFERVSLGGVRDEAEIRGHRRTYIGAMPGRIVQALKRAATRNPVILLDELDKMSMDFRGDPSSALLEVLDPEQNHSFMDHYLDVELDLSDVLFITTANDLFEIPGPLRDRLEIIELSGYTDEEKTGIARRFLIPRQIKEHGLKPENVNIEDKALAAVIRGYTREAGVRSLERRIGDLCRKAARLVVARGARFKLTATIKNLRKLLGPVKRTDDDTLHGNSVGVATGLAWTGDGGEVLSIEVLTMKGKGELELTGTLGDVMKESGLAAMSWVRSRAKKLGLKEGFHRTLDLHIHIPEGATPKDGPSAGVTLVTAMVSALTGRAVKPDIAMTGEITLRGRVLPIGGLKEKALAARRAGIKELVIPRSNEKDVEDVPKSVRKEMKIKLVSTLDQVLELALEPKRMSATRRRDIEQKAPKIINWDESRLAN